MKRVALSRLDRISAFFEFLIFKLLLSMAWSSVNVVHAFTILIKCSILGSKRGSDVRTTFTGTIQVLQRDSARGEACLFVLNRVTSRERNLDGWVVRGVTERGVTE
jgi:hypothetical protein